MRRQWARVWHTFHIRIPCWRNVWDSSSFWHGLTCCTCDTNKMECLLNIRAECSNKHRQTFWWKSRWWKTGKFPEVPWIFVPSDHHDKFYAAESCLWYWEIGSNKEGRDNLCSERDKYFTIQPRVLPLLSQSQLSSRLKVFTHRQSIYCQPCNLELNVVFLIYETRLLH